MKNLRWIALLLCIVFFAERTYSQNIEVAVIDSYSEKAVSGVKIEPVCIDRTRFTNTDGKATMNLGVGHCCNLKITKLGYAPETVEVCPEDERVELYFYKTFTIKGRLKSPTGTLLNRARIELGSECGDGMRVVYTDAAGRFNFTPPAIGACCYQLVISHPLHPENTAVFCSTDEVSEKDIRLEYSISDTEQFTVADVSYTTKTLSAAPALTSVSSAPVSQTILASTYTPSAPTIVYDAPTYTPAPVYTPAPTYTPAPPTYTSEATTGFSSKNKYIDPMDLSLNNATPSSANLSYFDVNQSAIRGDAYARLDNIAMYMQSNPDFAVEIAVHCDARGDYGYNQNLSERRARALADYLVSKGVTKNRLIVKGYGESQLINHCADGVTCSETEHRQNRRSLFRVTGSIYDADYTTGSTYAAYQPSIPTATTTSTVSPTTATPAAKLPPGVPCPDCPLPQLDDEKYMDDLHGEEYYDDNFYDADDGN